jgi:hypothetical protein
MKQILCSSCQHFAPALDPTISRAFLGGCRKKEYPFTLILPLDGVSECEVYQRSARAAAVPGGKPQDAARVAARASGPAGRRVQLCYSSRHPVGEQFPCDIGAAKRLLGELRGKGVAVEECDLAATADVFPLYHKAVTGPSAAKRAVFGMKGALEADFGRRVPALLVFEGDRYPTEVFPRMDRELNRVIGVEEALERLLAT